MTRAEFTREWVNSTRRRIDAGLALNAQFDLLRAKPLELPERHAARLWRKYRPTLRQMRAETLRDVLRALQRRSHRPVSL